MIEEHLCLNYGLTDKLTKIEEMKKIYNTKENYCDLCPLYERCKNLFGKRKWD